MRRSPGYISHDLPQVKKGHVPSKKTAYRKSVRGTSRNYKNSVNDVNTSSAFIFSARRATHMVKVKKETLKLLY